MLTFGIESIVVLLLVMGAVSALGGYAFAQARQRRAGGGRTAEELKTELGEYRDNVTEHFQTTANLLHEMTEQYRSVYEHMAAGAQQLCDPEQATSQIESLRAGLLPAQDVPAASEDEEVTVPPVSAPDTGATEAGDGDAGESEASAAADDLDEHVPGPTAVDEDDQIAAGTDEPERDQNPELVTISRT